jgi:hypothetical protein
VTSRACPSLIEELWRTAATETHASNIAARPNSYGVACSMVQALVLVALAVTFLVGCAASHERIDARVVNLATGGVGGSFELASYAGGVGNARADERDDKYLEFEANCDARDEEDEEEGAGSVILGEMLAIFPGLLWHGVGHHYAGDYQSSRRIRSIGEWGYLLTAIGGGLLVGAYALDESSDGILPISLYVSGGAFAVIGLGYFFTAWGADIYDTPRAVRENGRPWEWLDDDDVFED